MEKEIATKNWLYLRKKEEQILQLKKYQSRRVATVCVSRLRDLPVLDRDTVGDELRAIFSPKIPTGIPAAELCREIALQMPELTPAAFFPGDGDESEKTIVSYLKNAHSAQAFRALSARMPNAEAMTATSSGRCCEDVSSGGATACILPLCTGKDGILTSFCALVEQHELLLQAITRVEIPGTEDYTLFGLLKRHLDCPPHPDYFVFAIHEDLLTDSGEILSAVKLLGGTPIRFGTVPVGKESSSFLYLFVLNVSHGNLTAILLYLELCVRSYLPFGVFCLE